MDSAAPGGEGPVGCRPGRPDRAAREARRERLRRWCIDNINTEVPAVLEIGCGHGHFLVAYAAAHPGVPCVGIDLQPDRIERAERKRERARLGNARFVRADAEDFLAALPEAARFARIFVLFPDPWPKRRHHKNRLLRPEFLSALACRCVPGARLHVRTDHAHYFGEVQAAIDASPEWTGVGEPWPFELETVFQQRAPSYSSLTASRTAG
jgi:tRNA (guanine-N7-)-methyltransferase